MKWILLLLLALGLGGCAASTTSWVQRNGGLVSDARTERVGHIAAPLQTKVQILGSREPCAYSFPSGEIYITAGLVDAATDGEIAGAIAHEMGHLVLKTSGAIGGRSDQEARADQEGVKIMEQAGWSRLQLAAVLRKVAGGNPGIVKRAENLEKSALKQP